jgi:hypothetical protein
MERSKEENRGIPAEAKPTTAINATVKLCASILKSHREKVNSVLAKGSPLAADDEIDCVGLLDLINAAQSLYSERCPIA